MNGVKASLVDLNNSVVKEIELPKQFEEELRIDLIRRAFHAERSTKFQPKGAFAWAGLQTSAEYIGRRRAYRTMINIGRARLPKEKRPKGRFGRVLRVPQAVKGRRAHPPKPWKKIVEKINLREKKKALRSAISATVNKELVEKRGHRIGERFPLIVSNEIESIKKTSELNKVLERLGLQKELERARKSRKALSGVARRRRGGHREARSALIVVGEDKGILKAARNLPGVEATVAKNLSTELLAPGGSPGRLTVWSEGAVEALEKQKLFL